jgi:hypothetical protein
VKVAGKVLAKLIEWCEHHQRTGDDKSGWESTFVQMTTTDLCNVMTAASYLDIHRLSYLCAKTFAEHITGKSARQLHVNLNLSGDFEPDEYDDITQENGGQM